MSGSILVTGNLGYIGSELVKSLTKKYNVVGVDANYFDNPIVKNDYNIKQYTFDIRNIDYEKIFLENKIRFIIHLANISNDPMGEIDSSFTKNINLDASYKLFCNADKYKVDYFINYSSCSVYGFNPNIEYMDESCPTNPLSEYAKCKILFEEKIKSLRKSKIKYINMRNSTVFGFSDNLRLDLVVNDFLFNAKFKKKIKILSDGTPWRPLVHLKDLITITNFFIENDNFINNNTINIGFNNMNLQVRDIAKVISDFYGAKLEILAENPSDKRSYKVSFKNINKKLKDKSFTNIYDACVEFDNKIESNKLNENSFYDSDSIRIKKLKNIYEKIL